jgi:hypothetical protein
LRNSGLASGLTALQRHDIQSLLTNQWVALFASRGDSMYDAGRSHWPGLAGATRHMALPTSSATSRAPARSTATPTGRTVLALARRRQPGREMGIEQQGYCGAGQ